MKLYRISQTVNNGYDTYDAAVVVAESPEAAKLIHPSGTGQAVADDQDGWNTTWVDSLDDVQVEYLGEADPASEAGRVIVFSFHAG